MAFKWWLAALACATTACGSDHEATSGGDSSSTGGDSGSTAIADDGVDDGVDDTGCPPATWWPDTDEDGFGDPSSPTMACEAPAGHVDNDGDCDDSDPEVNPDATEVCDEVDNDCSGTADDIECFECAEVPAMPEGHLYLACTEALTWADAEAYCNGQGGHLVVIGGQQEQLLMLNVTTAFPSWIGLTDEATEGTFAWVDGSPFTYDNWVVGEPDDPDHSQNCVAMNGTLRWSDLPCEGQSPFVCEIEP